MAADGTAVVIAQDYQAAHWYRWHGAREVYIGGDLKGDRTLPPNPLRWSRPFVVAASTHEGDEVAVLDAVATLEAPHPSLLLAPRHPERFEAVATLLEDRGTRWMRRTDLAEVNVPVEVDVLLLDTLGELAGCLQGAGAAFVGGTFDPTVGGHSPAEAVRAGVPVVCGPHTWANAASFERAAVHRAGPEEGLAGALRHACATPRPVPKGNGAGARTARALAHWLKGPAAPEHTPRPWARPVTPLWGLGAAARQAGASLGRPDRLDVPVVAVGSPNARGPGRTSTTRWVADQLQERGHRVGIAVRGYQRTSPGREVRTSWHTREAGDLGDEGAMLARAGHWVAASPDRVAAARCLAEGGATVVVVDDGLSSHGLARDVDLLVVDARFPSACGLLPAGYRREWATVPPHVTGVVVHHAGERGAVSVPPGAAVARRIPGPWHRGERRSEPPRGPVAAVVGIARPADFLATLEVPVARVRVLRDHQPVDPALAAELQHWAGALPLVCTAKDHPRLPPDLREVAYWRDVDLEVEGFSEAWFPPSTPLPR
jgi:tetraacyldisaccharide 4'-kinase